MTIKYTTGSWNPVVGCSPIASGCKYCYAAREASTRLAHLPAYEGLTKDGNWTGLLRERDAKTWQVPLRRQKPQTYFVCSTSDLFHESIYPAWIDRAWATMALSPRHTFDVLTKRADRASEHLNDPQFSRRVSLWVDVIRRQMPANNQCHEITVPNLAIQPLRNVRLGASASTSADLRKQINGLRTAPANIRWLSLEPLIKEMSLAAEGILPHEASWEATEPSPSGKSQGTCMTCARVSPGFEKVCRTIGMVTYPIDWIVIGGESGPNARPFHVEWGLKLVAEAKFANVPVYFKQLGSNAYLNGQPYPTKHRKGEDPKEWPDDELRTQQHPEFTQIVHDGATKLTFT